MPPNANLAAAKPKMDACLAHATDLLRAAEAVRTQKLPHVAYHLAVLGLEEVGKAMLFVADANIPASTEGDRLGPLKRADDHVHKLFWSIWGPSMWRNAISQEHFESMKGFAAEVHKRRLRGLYVSTEVTEASLPQDAVTESQCDNLIALLRAAVRLAETHEFKELTAQEASDLEWFMSIREDPDKLGAVFNPSTVAELQQSGEPRSWLRSIRAKISASEVAAKELAAKELSSPKSEDLTPKWNFRLHLYTASHSLRPKELLQWNESMGVAVLNVGNKKEGQLVVDLLLPRRVHARDLWTAGWGMACSLLASLNIATRGFFWWYLPKQTSRYYEGLTDLENKSDLIVERTPKLTVDWRGGVLTNGHLLNVAGCMASMTRVGSSQQHCLDSYMTGLALLARNDIHLQTEGHAFDSFYLSLRDGLRAFGAWDGSGEYQPIFKSRIDLHFATEESRAKYGRLGAEAEDRLRGRGPPSAITLEEAAVMKRMADAWLQKALLSLVPSNHKTESGES